MNKKRGLFSANELGRRFIDVSDLVMPDDEEDFLDEGEEIDETPKEIDKEYEKKLAQDKINQTLLDAQTAEETKKAIEMGADVNFEDYRYEGKYGEHKKYSALSVADVEQAIVLINSGANIEQLNKNKYLSDKEKLEVLNGIDYKKLTGKDIEDIEQIQIHIEIKQRIAKAKEAIAKRDGIVEQPQSASHDSNSPTPSKPNGRDDGGR